jgi:hypothetical protein
MEITPKLSDLNPDSPLSLGSGWQSQQNHPFKSFVLGDMSVDNLNVDLDNLRSQVEQLKDELAGKEELAQLNDRLDEITASVQKASEKGQELKAKVLLPPSELMDVQLIPSHSLERLEEYRSDEKKAYVLLGVFLGCVFGILSNWAIQDTFVWTRQASVLLVLFLILTFGLAIWAHQINSRVVKVKNRMLTDQKPEESNHISDQNVYPKTEEKNSSDHTVDSV